METAAPTLIPAMPPPPGQSPNFANPDTLWKWNVLCQAMCVSIPGILFILRTYVRYWVKKTWILEDYFCCLSFFALAIYSALLTTLINNHGGTHTWDITAEEYGGVLYWVNITQIWYGIAAAFIKVGILLLFIRIFSPSRGTKFDILLRTFIAIICIFYFALTVAKIIQCLPREAIWDSSLNGHCVDLSALLNTSGLFNITSDVCILVIPIKGLWNLQVSRKRKLGIYFVFTVGIIAPIFSIVGFVMRFTLAGSADQSYNQPVILLWATAELATGMMIICLPTLPGIIRRKEKQPEMSAAKVQSGSSKCHPRYGMRLDEDNMLLEPDDYDYLEREPSTPRIKRPENVIVNDIKGGEAFGNLGPRFASTSRDNAPPGRIMKMVTIEQSV